MLSFRDLKLIIPFAGLRLVLPRNSCRNCRQNYFFLFFSCSFLPPQGRAIQKAFPFPLGNAFSFPPRSIPPSPRLFFLLGAVRRGSDIPPRCKTSSPKEKVVGGVWVSFSQGLLLPWPPHPSVRRFRRLQLSRLIFAPDRRIGITIIA